MCSKQRWVYVVECPGALFLPNAISILGIFQQNAERLVIGTNSRRQARSQDFRSETYLLCNDGFSRTGGGQGPQSPEARWAIFVIFWQKKKAILLIFGRSLTKLNNLAPSNSTFTYLHYVQNIFKSMYISVKFFK